MKFTLIVLSVFCSLTTFSQQSSTVTVFTDEDTKDLDESGVYESVLHNTLKWNIGMLGRGAFFVEYEREVLKWLSLESGLGITYFDAVNFILLDMDSELGSYSVYEVESGYGPAFSVRTRIYPGTITDMEGFYVSLATQARWYNSKTYVQNEAYKTGIAMQDAHFAIGWQQESYLFDEMNVDFYFGVGIRNFEYTYYDRDEMEITNAYANRPAFIAGIKLGYPF